MRPEREAAHRRQTGDRSTNQDSLQTVSPAEKGKRSSTPALAWEDRLPEALRRLRLPELARGLGLSLPDRPGPCRSPFREDRSPSFSWFVGTDGRDRWKDFATGEKGDAVDFVARALGLSPRDALLRFLELAGLGTLSAPLSPLPPATPAPAPRRWTPKAEGVRLPEDTREGTPEDLSRLCEARGWDAGCIPALEVAGKLGVLRFATYQGEACWLLVDSALRFFEARRVDGLDFEGGGKSRARGSKSLLGAEKLEPGSPVLFLEGAPDFLAAHYLRLLGEDQGAVQVGSAVLVAALGANGGKLRPEDLERFNGTRVLIIPHRDPAGLEACIEWRRSLLGAGAEVRTLDLSAPPYGLKAGGKDLADCFNPLPSYDLLFAIEGTLQEMKGGDAK